MKTDHREDILELVKRRAVLFDGAIGTMLMAEGLQAADVPETWNRDKPETVKSIHRCYFGAGSDVVLTNSFGGNRLKLGKKKLENEAYRLNALAAELAKAVCPPDKFVAGDIGPCGELISPLGSLKVQDVEDMFAEQSQALVSGGVDLVVIETMFSLQEALAALRGARRVDHCPVFVSMTFERKDHRYFTMMGETPEVCMKALESEGADTVGVNCTLGSGEMIPLVRILRESTSLPLIVQPNAGKPVVKDGKTSYDQTAEEFADDIQVMLREGVNVVGGCCGTTPKFIAAIHNRLSKH